MKDLNAAEIAAVAGGNARLIALSLGATALVALFYLTPSKPACNWQIVKIPGKTFIENPHFENGDFVKGYEVEFYTDEWKCR